MAYNNYFPAGYQPAQIYYPTQPNQFSTPQNINPTQPTQHTGIIWVSGEAGAKAYMVAPNTTVQLWDSESQTIFLKSADASGMPSMRVLDYTIRDNAPVTPKNTPKIDFATKDDISTIQAQIDEIKANISRKKGVKNESTISDDGSK